MRRLTRRPKRGVNGRAPGLPAAPADRNIARPPVLPAPPVPTKKPYRLKKRSSRLSGGFKPILWPGGGPLAEGAAPVYIEKITFPAARKARRAPSLPPFWVSLEPLLADRRDDANMLRLRQLVLQARALPYQLEQGALYAPLFVREAAAAEIRAFENERRYAEYLERMEPEFPKRDNWIWVFMLLALLAFWNSLRYRAGEWGLSFLPHSPDGWAEVGALAKSAATNGEWWRCFTALTLHADAEHLLGNILFGAIFLLLLCRRTGLGLGVFVTVFSAAVANACNIMFQAQAARSIGFSTAVFAALGALCGLAALRALTRRPKQGARQRARLEKSLAAHAARRERREIFVSLAVGMAFLAFIGGSGVPRVDFSAHALGFAAGAVFIFVPGWVALLLSGPEKAARFYNCLNGGLGRRAQALFLAVTFFMLALAWSLAFAAYWK